MYWQQDSRYGKGGYWHCAVKAREYARERYRTRGRDTKLRQARERYDADPVFRIEKRLHDDARRRRQRLDARRARFATEQGGSVGALPLER